MLPRPPDELATKPVSAAAVTLHPLARLREQPVYAPIYSVHCSLEPPTGTPGYAKRLQGARHVAPPVPEVSTKTVSVERQLREL